MIRIGALPSLLGILVAGPVMGSSDTLDQELSILADRFFLRFPKEAKNEARAVDIMSAPPGEDEETRITLDRGDERVVFFAQELQMLGTADLAGDWDRAIERPGQDLFITRKLRKEGPFEVTGYAPRVVADSGEAILVSGRVVRCADGMLMNVQAFVNVKARQHLSEYAKLIELIFHSLRQGSRVTDLSAREVRLPFMGSKERELVIPLPEKHVITTDNAYDFFVYRIRKAPVLGEQDRASLTLYFGDHPSLYMSDLQRDPATADRTPGTLFGKPIEWLTVNDEATGTHLMEQIVPMGRADEHLVAHVAVAGNAVAEVKSLVVLAERMRLEP